MARAYFPLRKNDPDAIRLLQAAKLIEEVIREYTEDVYSGSDGQFDNSASDGASLGLLELAVRILRNEVK